MASSFEPITLKIVGYDLIFILPLARVSSRNFDLHRSLATNHSHSNRRFQPLLSADFLLHDLICRPDLEYLGS
jgi:hypothetical protein